MTKKALDTNDLVIVTKTHHNLSDLKKIGFLDKIFSKKILFISNKAHKDLKLNKVQWTKKKKALNEKALDVNELLCHNQHHSRFTLR